MSSEFETAFWDMCMNLEENLLAAGLYDEYQERRQQKRIQQDQEIQRIIEEFNSKRILKAKEAKEKDCNAIVEESVLVQAQEQLIHLHTSNHRDDDDVDDDVATNGAVGSSSSSITSSGTTNVQFQDDFTPATFSLEL
jgi:hypothetical protein